MSDTIAGLKFYRVTDEFTTEETGPGYFAVTEEGRVLLWMGGNNFVDLTGTNPFFQFEDEDALVDCYTSSTDPRITIKEISLEEVGK